MARLYYGPSIFIGCILYYEHSIPERYSFVRIKAHRQAAAVPAQPVESHHPKGWRFRVPKGDPLKGKTVFQRFECYYSHEIRGEQFPDPIESATELSQMGGMHPVEFFTESIMNPNAVVPKAYRESDGKSPMTDFTEKMTVREYIEQQALDPSLELAQARAEHHRAGEELGLAKWTAETELISVNSQ